MTKVFIDGSEGTTGLRIFERFEKRDDITLLKIDPEKRKDPAERKKLINQSDIAFLCLPDDAARESVSLCENDKTVIIDTSTAHRTEKGWSYGFPELSLAHRKAIETGKRIAVPGCHASGFIALVYPLVAMGIIGKDLPLSCFSITGYSGGGKKMIAQYEDENRDEELSSPRQYGLTQKHKHLKEMQAICSLQKAPIFAPIVSDFYSGMVVSVPLHRELLQKDLSLDALRQAFSQYYEGANFVKVLPESGKSYLGSNNLSGYDGLQIELFGNDDRMMLTASFDNLGKGASGAAVQCMNIALGLDETTSLHI